jgi:hypothetical protein
MSTRLKFDSSLLDKAREEQKRINRGPRVSLLDISNGRKEITDLLEEMHVASTVQTLIAYLEKLHGAIKLYLPHLTFQMEL